jgi:multidrug resistance efflux pump
MKAVIEQANKINSKVMLYNNAISTQIEADQRLITALSEAARLGQALLGATTYKDIEAAKTALHKAESEVAAARQALSMPRLQLIVLKQNYQRSIRDSRD